MHGVAIFVVHVFHNYTVQFHFRGISHCEEWKNNATSDKLMTFSNQLLDYIRDRCDCNFPSAHIHQSRFICFESSPDHITFRATIVAHPNWKATKIVPFLEEWRTSHTTVMIQGEILSVVSDEECPVAISASEESAECQISSHTHPILPYTQTPASYDSNVALIGGSLAGIGFLLMIVAIVVCLILKLHKRYNIWA